MAHIDALLILISRCVAGCWQIVSRSSKEMDHMDERLQGVRVCNQLDIYLTRWWRMTGWS